MSSTANVKHSFALALIAFGAIAVFLSGVCLFVAFDNQKGDAIAGWIGCAAVSAVFGAPLLWYGFRLRNRVAPLSTAFKEQTGIVRTSRTETARPSFLENESDPH